MRRTSSQPVQRVAFLCALTIPLALMTAQGMLGQSQQPTVMVGADNGGTVSESAGSCTFTIGLSSPSSQTVTVQYATVDGTAKAGTDYTSTSGTATFSPGQTMQMVTVPLLDDGSSDDSSTSETFSMQLSNAVNANISQTNGSATMTITEGGGGTSGPAVAFQYSSWTVNEADGSIDISVVLTGTPTSAVTVNYATSDGTAKAGVNYLPANGTLVWQPSEAGTAKTFTIVVLDDMTVDPTLTVNLALSGPVNASLGTQSTAVLDIMDSDGVCTP